MHFSPLQWKKISQAVFHSKAAYFCAIFTQSKKKKKKIYCEHYLVSVRLVFKPYLSEVLLSKAFLENSLSLFSAELINKAVGPI